MEATHEKRPKLSIEELEAMTAQEIIVWYLENQEPKLSFQKLAKAMTPYRPDYNSNTSTNISVSSKQVWNMRNGIFGRYNDAQHHIAFIRYFFPDNSDAEKIFIRKISEVEGKVKKVGSSSSTQALSKEIYKIRGVLATQTALARLIGITPKDAEVLVAAHADHEDPTKSLITITGRASEVRQAIAEILSNLEASSVVAYTETNLTGLE